MYNHIFKIYEEENDYEDLLQSQLTSSRIQNIYIRTWIWLSFCNVISNIFWRMIVFISELRNAGFCFFSIFEDHSNMHWHQTRYWRGCLFSDYILRVIFLVCHSCGRGCELMCFSFYFFCLLSFLYFLSYFSTYLFIDLWHTSTWYQFMSCFIGSLFVIIFHSEVIVGILLPFYSCVTHFSIHIFLVFIDLSMVSRNVNLVSTHTGTSART